MGEISGARSWREQGWTSEKSWGAKEVKRRGGT